MRRTWRQGTAVMAVALVVVGLAGCSDKKKETTTQTSVTPTEPPNTQSPSGSFTVTAKEYGFDIPSNLTGGVVTMTMNNVGQKDHDGLFVRVGDTPKEQVLVDFAKLEDGGPTPAYMGFDGGAAELAPGKNGSSTFKLTPGKYLFVCTLTDDDTQSTGGEGETSTTVAGAGSSTTVAGRGTSTTRAGGTTTTQGGPTTTAPTPPKHYTLGMATPVTVAGDTGQALPTNGPSITAKDFTFDAAGLKAGSNTVLFQNTGPKEDHHVVVFEYPAGVSESGALKAFQDFGKAQAENKPPPSGTPQPTPVGEVQPFDPGLGGTFDVTLQAGRAYVLACFIPDKSGGPPHAFGHNMLKAITVK